MSTEEAKLRFTPYAWAKLLYLRDKGQTEISAFALSSKDDLLLVHDLLTVKQDASCAHVQMDTNAVSQYFEDLTDEGYELQECARIWIHTHPSGFADPSSEDEKTFHDAFGKCNWAIMFILSRTGETHCVMDVDTAAGRQRFHVPIEIVWDYEFPGSDIEEWDAEHEANVTEHVFTYKGYYGSKHHHWQEDIWDDDFMNGHYIPDYDDPKTKQLGLLGATADTMRWGANAKKPL